MAQYGVRYECGHVVTEQLYGKSSERELALERAKSRQCRECYRQSQREQAAAETADLPALVGTEKQIAWATTIRARLVGEIAAEYAAWTVRYQAALPAASAGEAAAGAATNARWLEIISRASAKKEASWWIDRRAETGHGVVSRAQARQAVAS